MTTLNPIANRIARIEAGNDPQFLARMPSGYAILANQQPPEVRGGCMLLPTPDPHGGPAGGPSHLGDLSPKAQAQFLADFALLGEAVRIATGAQRLNYLILCNQVPWLHAHVVPRFANEDPKLRLKDPFEAYDFGSAPKANAAGPEAEIHRSIAQELAALLG
ncbi:MAG: hypothetical protein AAGI53_07750 [Planctomycetota bacterium]